MAVTTVGSFPAIGVKVMEEGSPVVGDNTIAHGLPYTPKVYSVVPKDASPATSTWQVKTEDATNVVIAIQTNAPEVLRVVLGP